MNNSKQFSTDQGSHLPEVVSGQTGLTALQERCAVMLAAGSSVTDVATALDLDRGTIYGWRKKVTFACYLNKIQQEAQDLLKGGLFGLQGQALLALQESLTSQNEHIRLKAAMWLIERLTDVQVGNSDPREAIKSLCTEDIWAGCSDKVVDESKYRAMLLQEGLDQ